MSKTLVAYFSASGVTEKLAKSLAEATGGDLYEIKPAQPYTAADLDWMDEESRSTREMKNKSFRPRITGQVEHMEQYDRVFVGFPIWWYVAPTIINTFLEQYEKELIGKKVIPFATSGSSGMGNTNRELQGSCEGAELMEGRRFSSDAGVEELRAWAEQF